MTSTQQKPWSNGRPARVAHGTLAALGLGLGILFMGCWAGSALAAAPAGYQGSLDSMVRFLQDDQNPDGGFGKEPGEDSNNDISAWVALALAAAGINPRDQTPADQHYIGGHSVYGYLTEHAGELSASTDFERELLVVDAAGTSPTDFGGVNLVEKILQRQLTQPGEDGAFVHEAGSSEPGMNDTIFAILALSPIHEPDVEAAVQAAAEWVENEQDCDGGWPGTEHRTDVACPTGGGSLPHEPESEVDMTGAAIEALNAAERQRTAKVVEEKAFEYLKKAEDPDGGFPERPGEPEPNVASTAWVVQAMWSAGINPETWVTHSGLASEEPLSYLVSLQQEDGHIRFEESHEENGVFMTAYVGAAMAGDPYPIPKVPEEPLPSAPSETSSGGASGPSPTAPGGGQGGESSKSGQGVIAGGGGSPAVLFGRPQPGSKGRTPGGARQLTKEHAKDRRRHRDNPGHARTSTAPTVQRVDPAAVPKPDRSVAPKRAKAHKKAKPAPADRGVGDAPADRGVGDAPGDGGGGQAAGREIKGFLVGGPAAEGKDALEPGAPGLHGAGAGGDQSAWLAIGIAVVAVLLALLGSLLERRRPQAIL